jgi:hypothetical protein
VIFVKDSSDQNQYAGSFFVKPDIEVAAVTPPVTVSGRQTAQTARSFT